MTLLIEAEPEGLSFRFETPHWRQGSLVAGIDEAGRGPLAGPVVAAAVIFPPHLLTHNSRPLIADSKTLTAQQREAAEVWIKQTALSWVVAECSVAEIDQLNILWASMEAMRRSVLQLDPPPNYCLVDGNRAPHLPFPSQPIVKGDARCFSIAAAGILAKTHRDRLMTQLHSQHPHYGWDRNKGYGTPQHLRALQQFGPTIHHRKTFVTVLHRP